MFKDILKPFLTYGFGSIAQTALNFLLLPLYLRFFEPSEYGIISLLLVVSSLLSMFANIGINSGMYRIYYEIDEGGRKKLAGTAWFWYLLSAGLIGIALYIFSGSLSQSLFQSINYSYTIQVVSVFFIFSVLRTMPFNILRMEKKAGLYVALSLLMLGIDFGLKLYFIVFLRRGIEGYFESSLITNFLILCILVPFVLKYVSFSINSSYLKQLLRLGFPFIFSTLSVWTLEFSDRLMLNHFSGETAVGIYSLAYRFANLFVVFLLNPSSLFWQPYFFSYNAKKTREEVKRLLNRSLIYFFVISCFLYLIISLGSGDVLRIFTSLFGAKEEYLQSLSLIPLLTLGPFFYILSRQASNALLVAKKPKFEAIAGCITAVVNVGLNFIFIPMLGTIGAAITTVLAYILYDAVCYWWAQRVWPVNHDWKGISISLFFMAVAFLVCWQIDIKQPWISLFVKVASGVSIFGLGTWFISHIFTRDERRNFITYVFYKRKEFVKELVNRI